MLKESLTGFAPIPTGSPRIGHPAQCVNPARPDTELVRMAKQGNARAFEVLVVKYQRLITRLVARYVKRPADVEDVVQGVFIKAYLGIGAFKGESAFYTWLYRIAKNSALDFVTRQSQVVVLEEDIAPDGLGESADERGSEQSNPEHVLCVKQVFDSVERAMTSLDPDLARALRLYALEGCPYQEIAQILEVPIGTVRTRIFRARNFIARRLEPSLGVAIR